MSNSGRVVGYIDLQCEPEVDYERVDSLETKMAKVVDADGNVKIASATIGGLKMKEDGSISREVGEYKEGDNRNSKMIIDQETGNLLIEQLEKVPEKVNTFLVKRVELNDYGLRYEYKREIRNGATMQSVNWSNRVIVTINEFGIDVNSPSEDVDISIGGKSLKELFDRVDSLESNSNQ